MINFLRKLNIMKKLSFVLLGVLLNMGVHASDFDRDADLGEFENMAPMLQGEITVEHLQLVKAEYNRIKSEPPSFSSKQSQLADSVAFATENAIDNMADFLKESLLAVACHVIKDGEDVDGVMAEKITAAERLGELGFSGLSKDILDSITGEKNIVNLFKSFFLFQN